MEHLRPGHHGAQRRRSRRAVLTAGLAGGVAVGLAGGLAGCDVTGPPSPADGRGEGPPSGATGATRGATTGEGASTGPEPADSQLVDGVLEEVAATAAAVRDALRASPSLRGDLRPVLDLHEAQARVLGARLDPRAPRRARGSATALLDDVRRRERRLHDTLVEAALQARSGALARVLASMSAGVSQRLVVLGPVSGA